MYVYIHKQNWIYIKEFLQIDQFYFSEKKYDILIRIEKESAILVSGTLEMIVLTMDVLIENGFPNYKIFYYII